MRILIPWLMQAASMYELGPRDLTEDQRSLWVSPADRAALALARVILATDTGREPADAR